MPGNLAKYILLKIFVKKFVLLFQAITSGDLCKRNVPLKKLYVQF